MDPTSPPPDPPLLGAEDDFIQPRNMRIQCNDQQLVQNPDMISALPDDILIQMLSLMTVREAAMTDCLSTRWRHLWENLENLILDSRAFGMQLPENLNYRENPELWNSETTRFVNKVNEVLCHHNGSRVKKFVVQFPLTSAHASEIDRWVAFAAASQAESLLVGLSNKLGTVARENSELYNFPLKHFADMRGCRLRELYLCKCSLETVPTKLNGFSCLATLFLNRVQVVDEVLLNITSSLCVLRFLRLKRCNKLINLRISHAKLVFMDVYRCWGLFSISIHAEKLEYLSYEGNEVFIKYECAPILRELHALFKVDDQFPVDFMGEFPTLEILTLQFPSRLYVSHLLHHCGRFAGLKEIVLCLLTSWKRSIRSVAYLLKAVPLVETFKLEVHGNLRPLNKLNIRWPKNFIPTRLRTIKIGGFSGESELTQLLLFLLKWSPVLRTLLIDTHRCCYLGLRKWIRIGSEDATRCSYAREVARTHVAPEVSSAVKFSII